MRWDAEKLGIEKLTIKNQTLKAYLMTSDNVEYYNSPVFGSILKFVQRFPRTCKIKDAKTRVILIIENIDSVDRAAAFLKEILEIKSLQMQ
jgi:transcription-repair coupling factor (superfamily II helicase)